MKIKKIIWEKKADCFAAILPMGHKAWMDEVAPDIWSWSIDRGSEEHIADRFTPGVEVVYLDTEKLTFQEAKDACQKFWEEYVVDQLFEEK